MEEYRPEYIAAIAARIQELLSGSIHQIQDVHSRTHVLSINARIEAARSGTKGAGFRVVAEEFSKLNDEISLISQGLGREIQNESTRLLQISEGMAKQVRGERLSQIALSVMDVIDRNLYERSCDVRWWATDSSVVEVLANDTEATRDFACRRLGEILDSYTVYLDIVVVNPQGVVIANGRPGSFQSQGQSVASSSWFKTASSSTNGQEFSFEETHHSPLVKKKVLTYGCRVGRGETLGALGVLFHWEGLVLAVLNRVQGIDLAEDIQRFGIPTTIEIVSGTGRILASTVPGREGQEWNAPFREELLRERKTGYRLLEDSGGVTVFAHGYSPGFETYATGWFCFISQRLSAVAP